MNVLSQLDAMTPAANEVVSDTTNKRLRLGDGLKAGGIHLPNAKDVQDQAMTYAVAGGTDNDLVLIYSPAVTELKDGTSLKFKASALNTQAVTIKTNNLDPVIVQKFSGSALTALTGGEFITGNFYTVTYNGSVFVLNSTAGLDYFESDEINYTGGGHYTANHGKGMTPKLFSAVLRCITADASFQPGDEVPIYQSVYPNIGNYTAYASPTRIGIRMSNNTILLTPGQTLLTPTVARWKVVLKGIF